MGGGSLGILSGSSSGAHSLPHHSFILALLHTDSRLSLSCFFQLLPFFSLGLYVLTCPQEHLLSFYDSYTLLFILILLLCSSCLFRTLFSPPSTPITTIFWCIIYCLVTTYLPHSHRLLLPMPPSTHSFPLLWILPSRRAFCFRLFEPLLE